MSSTKAPFGLQPITLRGNGYNNGGLQRYTMGPTVAKVTGRNDPVKVSTNGYVTRLSGTARPLGVAVGFQWVDPVTKRPTWSNYVDTGTSSADQNVYAYVVDDMAGVFAIQADATVSQGDFGLNYDLSAVGSVNYLGTSQAVLKASSRTTAQATVRLVGFYQTPDNAAGDAFPICEVRWNAQWDATVSSF